MLSNGKVIVFRNRMRRLFLGSTLFSNADKSGMLICVAKSRFFDNDFHEV